MPTLTDEATRAYARLWTRLNAVNGLITDLEAERASIKAQQRQIANGIVSKAIDQLHAESAARRREEAMGAALGITRGTCDREHENHVPHLWGGDKFFCDGDVGQVEGLHDDVISEQAAEFRAPGPCGKTWTHGEHEWTNDGGMTLVCEGHR